jgi:catechol 2,3-dioxygenase-like lactoylglutathione lyase family enzyme
MAVAATVQAWLARSAASTPQVILIATGRKPGVGGTSTIVSEHRRFGPRRSYRSPRRLANAHRWASHGYRSGFACLALGDATLASMIGRLHGIVIDCEDPDALATFYESLLSMRRVQDEGDWVVIGDAPDRPGVAFARIPEYRPPTWPDGERPQYRHFDVRVDDLDLAEASVLELGATPLPGGGETFRVYADPAGHPFCLVVLSTSR